MVKRLLDAVQLIRAWTLLTEMAGATLANWQVSLWLAAILLMHQNPFLD